MLNGIPLMDAKTSECRSKDVGDLEKPRGAFDCALNDARSKEAGSRDEAKGKHWARHADKSEDAGCRDEAKGNHRASHNDKSGEADSKDEAKGKHRASHSDTSEEAGSKGEGRSEASDAGRHVEARYKGKAQSGAEDNPLIIKDVIEERLEISEGMQALDAKLFALEQSGLVSSEDFMEVKDQFEALKERLDSLLETSEEQTFLPRRLVDAGCDGTLDGNATLDKQVEQLDARVARLEAIADGQDVPDRVPEGAIRVDHYYTGRDDTLADTSMVPLGKDADGYERFVAFSPSEQIKPGIYYRDEAGNFTANRNEAVKAFNGVALDPSIRPDNAILDDKGNYWTPTGANKDGTQTFQPLRSGDDFDIGLIMHFVPKPFYQDAEGNFSIKKEKDSITAKAFEKSQWEPKLPEEAIAVNANGDSKIDFHMVSIGADAHGQERYVAVQQDVSATRPDQQIYTRNEDGSFLTLDGKPMEAFELSLPQYGVGSFPFVEDLSKIGPSDIISPQA